MRTKVHWRAEEETAIAKRWYEQHHAIGVPYTYRGLQKIAAETGEGLGYRPRMLQAANAQALLPKFLALVKAIEPEPVPTPVEEDQPAMTMEAIIRKIVKEELELFGVQLLRAMLEKSESRFLTGMKETSKEKEKKPIVLIVGGLPEQHNAVKRAFPQLDIRGYSQASGGNRLPTEDADLVIGMVRFISHPDTYILSKRYKEKWTMVNGASDSVKTMINIKLGLKAS